LLACQNRRIGHLRKEGRKEDATDAKTLQIIGQ
jgi:hypothetical protein